VIGLCQISWLPFPGRTKAQPASRSKSRMAVELRRHSGRGRLGFAQRRDLDLKRRWIDFRVIVGKQVERHRGNFFQQLVKRRRVGRSRNVIAMPGPDGRLGIPACGNREYRRLRPDCSVSGRTPRNRMRRCLSYPRRRNEYVILRNCSQTCHDLRLPTAQLMTSAPSVLATIATESRALSGETQAIVNVMMARRDVRQRSHPWQKPKRPCRNLLA
jgi:hypothetical protein